MSATEIALQYLTIKAMLRRRPDIGCSPRGADIDVLLDRMEAEFARLTDLGALPTPDVFAARLLDGVRAALGDGVNR